jgi:mannose-6-phosphate isomerase-like protein (cupin superfamily)
MLKEVAARYVRAVDFTAARPWGALDLAAFDTAVQPVSVRLHWTDQPYHWHTNHGDEVFVVLDGAVDMKTRTNGHQHIHRMAVGDVFVVREGVEHLAVPRGVARVLVIEREGGG